MRIKTGRQIARNAEREGPEDLNDAILEPVRESLMTRRRQAGYKEVIDELDDITDDSDLDDE